MKADIGDFMPPPFSDDFRAIAKPKVLPKGDYFIWEGEVPRKFAFVQSGLFRYLYIDQKGIEYTKGILPEGSFISSYSAMINESPSHFLIGYA